MDKMADMTCPYEVLSSKELNMTDKIIFSYLNKNDYVSVKELSDLFGISERTVKRSLAVLRGFKLIGKSDKYVTKGTNTSPDNSVKYGTLGDNHDTLVTNMTPKRDKNDTSGDKYVTSNEILREKKETKKRDLITNINNDLPININNIDPYIENTEYKNINTTKILKKQDDKSEIVHTSENSNQIAYTGENFQLVPQKAGEIVPVKPKKIAPKKSEPFRIPSREEVMELSKWYVQNKKDTYPDLIYVDLDYFCDDFFDKQESNGWRQNNGRPYKSWQGAVKFWLRIQMQMTMQGLKPRRELTNEELVEDYERTMCGKALPQPPEVEVMEETEEEKAKRRKKELEEFVKKNGISWYLEK